nr:hypothetical protein B0A51_01858 [Rachicladosporium sp. CCFEE 5018]
MTIKLILYFMYPTLLQISSLFLIYYIYTRISLYRRQRAFKRSTGSLSPPRLPQWDPILGLDRFREVGRDLKNHRLLESSSARFAKMGTNTLEVVVLGRHIIITTEPENLKTIQAVDFKKWSIGRRRMEGFRPLFGLGIFTTDGADWQHSRDMLRPNFVRNQVGELNKFERHVGRLIKRIPANGDTIDLSPLFFSLTMDSATEFLLGGSTDSLLRTDEHEFSIAFDRAQGVVARGSRWGPWAKLFPWLFDGNTFETDRDIVHAFVDRFVDDAFTKKQTLAQSSEKKDRYVFIDELVEQTSDRIRIRSECLNILLAGRDTTASLLTNVWFILSKRPDLWTSLQNEIAHLNGRAPNFEQLKDLKWLRALLNESLRLHPVVPQNSRQALEDLTLPLGGGPKGLDPMFVPKDTIVAWSVYSMHRRQDFYGPDADVFRPERWLDDPVTGQKGLRPGWEYLPFNGGARICLGQQYALTEASYVTVRLAQAFARIETRMEQEVWTENFNITAVNLGGAKVGLTART